MTEEEKTKKQINGRKEADDSLRETSQYLENLFKYANVPIIVWDSQFKITRFNHAFEVLTGRSAHEVVGKSIEFLFPADKLESSMELIRDTAGGKRWEAVVINILHFNGTVRTLLWNSATIFDSDGKAPVATIAQGQDITELKKADADREEALGRQQDVNALQQSLLAPGALEKKLKIITDAIVRIFNADFCRIWLIEPGDLCEQGCMHAEIKEGPHVCRNRDKCLHLKASSGRYTHIDGKAHARVPFGCYKIGRIASGEDHKFVTNDVVNDPRVHNHDWARQLGLVSFAGYQLKVPGRERIGVLALFSKHPVLFTEDAMLDSLSITTAFVIQQGIAEEALIDRVHELETFHKATVGRELKMRELKEKIAQLEEKLKGRSA